MGLQNDMGSFCSLKNQTFLWKASQVIIPSNTNLTKKHVEVDMWCMRCGAAEETLVHVLLHCSESPKVWLCSPLRLELHECHSFEAWWSLLENRRKSLKCSTKFLDLAAHLCWCIWKARNCIVFNQHR